MFRFHFVLGWLLICTLGSQAQVVDKATIKTDSTRLEIKGDSTAKPIAKGAKVDTAKKASYWGRPQKAALYAAILPGAGQVYNRQFWKVPVLYTGLGVLGYFLVNNHQEFVRYDKAVTAIADSQPNPIPKYTQAQIIQIRDFYRRNRDYTIIFTTVVYLLQIADAHVFAHLKGFNVSDNLAVHPAALPPTPGSAPFAITPGISLTLRLP